MARGRVSEGTVTLLECCSAVNCDEVQGPGVPYMDWS
jgi:hypothetical protein